MWSSDSEFKSNLINRPLPKNISRTNHQVATIAFADSGDSVHQVSDYKLVRDKAADIKLGVVKPKHLDSAPDIGAFEAKQRQESPAIEWRPLTGAGSTLVLGQSVSGPDRVILLSKTPPKSATFAVYRLNKDGSQGEEVACRLASSAPRLVCHLPSGASQPIAIDRQSLEDSDLVIWPDSSNLSEIESKPKREKLLDF